ncbi:glutamate--tRNA ligase [Streptomyces sp. NBC_00094]|uniref:glutamate--tRNA ligase n=1 Tax=Streptomyces sp. NBC_00094 TaxID=2903620 RepID=UPI00225716BA|nr:glutamate--tRNA ligase family protein [Streptomyces sp. NBC_00094]MCX5393609.1 glutamate--tRNA ligase family protein [Streptomyces sp. NBC_00094]
MLDLSVINAMFPPDLPEPADWERRFGPRDLPDGAEVTRFAPSPTGHLHIGGLYTAAVARALARQSGGVHVLRVEDTDRVRHVAGAAQEFSRLLDAFGLAPDEGGAAGDGAWGPYLQSERRDVYLSHVRDLLRRDRAYPCFCDRDRLARSAEEQRAGRSPLGYYGRWAPCRTSPPEEAARRLASGEPYVVRFRCPYEFPGRVRFTDRIRGSVTMQDNGNDIVLLKSSRPSSPEELPLPTYHFAHVVDDHLMRVTLVVRGEEWLSSAPVHLQLHAALGFEPPAYAHLAPLMKAEGASRRKLSKRKDPEASVEYYLAAGYPPAAVQHYLRGLANIRLMDVPTADALAAQVRLDGMRPSGPLLDLPKLHSLSREFIASLAPHELYAQLLAWAKEYDPELASVLTRHERLTLAAVAVARPEGAPARKDLERWSCFRDRYGFLFTELFGSAPPAGDDLYGGLAPDLVRRIAAEFAAGATDAAGPEEWYGLLRELAGRHGFAPDTAAWRRDPDRWAGPPREVANVVRVALTGAVRSPDLFAVARALGRDEVRRRLTTLAG